MFIADSQIHLWGASTPERPWPEPAPGTPPPHKPFPFTAEYLLGAEMDEVMRTTPSISAWRACIVYFGATGTLALG